MGPVLYRLLKVARRMRKRAAADSILQPAGGLADTFQAAQTPNINLGITPAPAGAQPTVPKTPGAPWGSVLNPKPSPKSVLSGPVRTEADPNFTFDPTLRPNPNFVPTNAPIESSILTGSQKKSPPSKPWSGTPTYAGTWHQDYEGQRDDLRHQVRMGDMSTWQAQKNMQHWRETNLPGQNGQKLGIPGGNAPTTQGFNYMLRQMAPTGTNAQNLREIRKAFNAATPQMRNTMFSNAMNLWQQGYTGKALNLNMMQAPVEQQAPPAG